MENKFKYCPSCGKSDVLTIDIKKIHCADCDLTFYKNVAAASVCIIEVSDKILFVVRNKNPQKGYLDLPGGFIDPGENAEDGIVRECIEELSADLKDLKYFHSFPNLYEYKGFVYNTCDIVFTAELKHDNLNIDMEEIKEIKLVDKDKIDYDLIAFPSIKKALKMYNESKK